MKNYGFGSWVGPALGVAGAVAGLSSNGTVGDGAIAGLLVGSLCAVWGLARWRPTGRDA